MGFITNAAKAAIAAGTLVWASDTIRAILVTSANNANADNDNVGDIGTLGELSGTGYVAGFGNAGRQALDSKAVVVDDANDRIELTAANEVWTAIEAGTVAAVLLYKPNTNDADSLLVGKIDLAAPKATNGGDLTIDWADSGVVFRHTNA